MDHYVRDFVNENRGNLHNLWLEHRNVFIAIIVFIVLVPVLCGFYLNRVSASAYQKGLADGQRAVLDARNPSPAFSDKCAELVNNKLKETK